MKITSVLGLASLSMMGPCESLGPGCVPFYATTNDGDSLSGSSTASSTGVVASTEVVVPTEATTSTDGQSAGDSSGATDTSLSSSGSLTTGTTNHEATGGDVACGDGMVGGDEECDDGNRDDEDSCTNLCKDAFCGDGIKGVGEGCDDGNQVDSDMCSNMCLLSTCGDGEVQPGESCDDGNQEDLDGCEVGCQETKIVRVFAGNDRTCALLGEGHLKCWGNNYGGALGYGHTKHIGDDEPASEAGIVDVGGKVLTVGLGFTHTCALLEGGSVRCWGLDRFGALGTGMTGGDVCIDDQQPYGCTAWPACCIGDNELPSSAPPVDVGGIATDLVVGGDHTCVLLEGGDIRCWGYGFMGQLGLGTTEDVGDDELPSAKGPVKIGGTVARIFVGVYHGCAQLNTGDIRCWGRNGSCELGLGIGFVDNDIGDDELPSSQLPVPVGGSVISMAPRSFHTCVLLEGGRVKCWGNAGYLGYENEAYIGCVMGDLPTPDLDVGGVVAELATGEHAHHNCVRLEDGTVRCWGSGYSGALGYGNEEHVGDGPDEMPPDSVNVGGTAASVSVGLSHTCVVLTSNEIRCWGDNSYGQLGYGDHDSLGDGPGEMPPPAVPLFK